MSKTNETAAERIARMRQEQQDAKGNTKENNELVNQLTHESDGEPDFSEIAAKLKKRHAEEKTSLMTGTVKYTIYVDEDVAEAFNALCLKRGDQRKYVNQALKDFVFKKVRELDIE